MPEIDTPGVLAFFILFSSFIAHTLLPWLCMGGRPSTTLILRSGHTRSWGYGYPTLLTPCFSRRGPTGEYGPLNPIKNTTYDFVGQLIGEIAKTFPDSALHLGGDEVDFACW